jgi:excisionase family DNA binding protein
MAAAIHMFCTLQEAARRLRISEEQIETMLQRGILREFREGPHRLLKAADVVLLARTLAASRCSSPAGARKPVSATHEPNVRLPLCAAVAAETRGRGLPRPGMAGQALPRRMAGAERATAEYGARGGRQRLERSPGPYYRPAAPTAPLSVREWFWEGLTQDRPIAIILLFGLAVLTLTAVVAGIFLAVKVL